MWFEVGKPTLAYPEHGFTTAGPDDQDDDIDPGDELIVRGTLRLIRHGEAVVGGATVPAWTGIRVEQVRAWAGGD